MPRVLETQRLRLRQWRDEDYPPFARLNADPRVMRYFPTTLSRERSDVMADTLRTLIAERGWGLWAVEESCSGCFVGFVGLHVPSADLPFSPCVEIGWRLVAEYWGRGYATEAAREALRFGFESLGLAEIVSFTAVANLRSRVVMERLGFRHGGETFDHPAVEEGHPLRLHVLYRLSAAVWKAGS